MIDPPIWTSQQLDADRLKAITIFRNERMEEPLEDYLEAFDEYQGYIEELLETTIDLTRLEAAALEFLTDSRLLETFRYLAAPPISQDDLKVLAEAPSFAKGRLHGRPEDVRRLIEVVRLVLDRRRFAWVIENREPTDSERAAAVMASAALMAASRQLRRSVSCPVSWPPAASRADPPASPPRKRYAAISGPHGAGLTTGRP